MHNSNRNTDAQSPANPYLAIPGQTVLVEGVCSVTGRAIVFVCGAAWMTSQTYRWYCEEIVTQADYVFDLNMGKRFFPRPEREMMPVFYRSPTAACPCCKEQASCSYFRCGACQMINCYGSVETRRVGHWWSKKTVTESRCGHCWRSAEITGNINSSLIAGVRDKGPDNSKPGLLILTKRG